MSFSIKEKFLLLFPAWLRICWPNVGWSSWIGKNCVTEWRNQAAWHMRQAWKQNPHFSRLSWVFFVKSLLFDLDTHKFLPLHVLWYLGIIPWTQMPFIREIDFFHVILYTTSTSSKHIQQTCQANFNCLFAASETFKIQPKPNVASCHWISLPIKQALKSCCFQFLLFLADSCQPDRSEHSYNISVKQIRKSTS